MRERLTSIELKGGLGNQLFQFACGLVLTGGKLENLYLNVEAYERDSNQGGFMLPYLFPDIRFQTTTSKGFVGRTAFLNFDRPLDCFLGELSEIDCNLYVSGFFQNYRQISPVLPYLRAIYSRNTRIFREYTIFPEKYYNWRSDERGERPYLIGIHLRRGDYLWDPYVKVFGIPHPDDVRAALDSELALIGPRQGIEVCAFSDDSDLASCLGYRRYRSFNENELVGRTIEEFVAMSECDALICSNSTFSYWAGVLSGRARRQYLPSQWFKCDAVLTERLLPEGRGVMFNARLL